MSSHIVKVEKFLEKNVLPLIVTDGAGYLGRPSRNVKRSLHFLVMALLTASAFAGLDDPASKPITVRSEFARGEDAIDSLSADAPLSTDKVIAAAWKVIASNTQRNTDTAAFKLGVYSSVLVACVGAMKTGVNAGDLSPTELADQTRQFCRYLSTAQKDLNLSTGDLQMASTHHGLSDALAWASALKAPAVK